MSLRKGAARSPIAIRAKPIRIEKNSTWRMSPLAKAPTTESGMMARRKSTAVRCASGLAYLATAAASGALPVKPAPGWMALPMTRPMISAKLETISK